LGSQSYLNLAKEFIDQRSNLDSRWQKKRIKRV
jgi:hypothetical protein